MSENPIRRSEIMERKVGDEHMLYDTLGRRVHVLNPTAYLLWNRCDGDHSLDEIIAEAASATGAPEEQVRADIEECLDSFRNLSLLKLEVRSLEM